MENSGQAICEPKGIFKQNQNQMSSFAIAVFFKLMRIDWEHVFSIKNALSPGSKLFTLDCWALLTETFICDFIWFSRCYLS